PQLPYVGQQADGKQSEEASPPTRRPGRRNGGKNNPREEWGKDRNNFLSDILAIANAVVKIKNIILDCTPEQEAALKKKVTSEWLETIDPGCDALPWIRDWAKGSLEEEADGLIQKGRVRRTPARASAPVQPGV